MAADDGGGHGHSHSGGHGHSHGGGHAHGAPITFADAERWAGEFESETRQLMPDALCRDVIAPLLAARAAAAAAVGADAGGVGPRPVIADVGAGTGYMTVRLARAFPGADIVATDIEPGMVQCVRFMQLDA